MKVYVLNRKILLVLFVVAILGTAFFVGTQDEYVEVNATPVTNRVIVLDAGHGLPDEGTMSADGTSEEELNLDVVLKLQALLEQSGAKVILTRSDENGIYEVDKNSIRSKKVSDMKNRVNIGNNSGAEIYVSIHMNYFEQTQYSGWQTFYQSGKDESKRLATLIQDSLTKNISQNTRTPMTIKGAYIMDKVTKPSIIVECGFLSNAEEVKKLKTDEYQSKLAWGIYIGIQEYFLEE